MLFQNVLDGVVKTSKENFGQNLAGVYLHGSMAMGCFNPDKSDIDIIVVVEESISDNQKLGFMNEIVKLNELSPKKGLEISVVKKEVCQKFVHPAMFELHFSPMHLEWFNNDPLDYVKKMNGEDVDLTAHFMIIKAYGIVLYGESISDVFGDIRGKDYFDSIYDDIENAGEDVEENPVYVILNLCRVDAYLTDSVVLSKKDGGEWGLRKMSSTYTKLIQSALDSYNSSENIIFDKSLAVEFCKDILGQIKRLNDYKYFRNK